MGKLTTFNVVLSRDRQNYQSGESVEGHVVMDIQGEISIKGIYLEFVGEASVSWSHNESDRSRNKRRNNIRHYKASETYFRYQRELTKRTSEGSGCFKLTEGNYRYPFLFHLPSQIPSSFTGSVGYIRYWVVGTLVKVRDSDRVCKVDFKVTKPLDLNLEKNAPVAQCDQAETVLCCLRCKSGPITCKFFLDRTGYVPGESIHIKGDIINASSRKISWTSARLMMCKEYYAQMKTKSETVCVAEICRGPIKSGGRDRWKGEALLVPPLPPSYLRSCSLMSVSYWVELVVCPSGPAYLLKVPLKVIIGTIPMQKSREPAPERSNLNISSSSYEMKPSQYFLPTLKYPRPDLSNVPENPDDSGKPQAEQRRVKTPPRTTMMFHPTTIGSHRLEESCLPSIK